MAKYLLEENLAERLICVGRNPKKPEVYSLGVGNQDPRYKYYQAHMLHEPDILMRIFLTKKLRFFHIFDHFIHNLTLLCIPFLSYNFVPLSKQILHQ